MIRVGINGLGRIGKRLVHIIAKDADLQVVAINDIYPNGNDLRYTLTYDSIYRGFDSEIFDYDPTTASFSSIDGPIKLSSCAYPDDVNWSGEQCDVVIDASGVNFGNERWSSTCSSHALRGLLITNSFRNVSDHLILGFNDDVFSPSERYVCSSICDSTALGPLYRLISDRYGVVFTDLTTLHPWLNYQNLNDGLLMSMSSPQTAHDALGLGRAAPGNLIPKNTSAVEAVIHASKYEPNDLSRAHFVRSIRVPTEVVSYATVCFDLETLAPSAETLVKRIDEASEESEFNLFRVNYEALVSRDLIADNHSAVIDYSSIESHDKKLRLSYWYDNEHGYASRVVDQVKFWMNRFA